VPGRSTRSLERMSDTPGKFSINRHFRREALILIAVFGGIIVLAGIGALLGPWLFEHFL
jgi:hypothetical protein